MPIAAADLGIIEAALHSDVDSVTLSDKSLVKITTARPKANGGKGVRCIKSVVASDGSTPIQVNQHDCTKASKYSDYAKSGRRVAWVLVGKFPHRAAVAMVDGKLASAVPTLPGAAIGVPGLADEGAAPAAKDDGKDVVAAGPGPDGAVASAKDAAADVEMPPALPADDPSVEKAAALEDSEPPLKAAKHDASAPSPADLSCASAVFSSVEKESEAFWKLEEILAAHLHGRNEDYNAKRIATGEKPLNFVLVAAEVVDNPVLSGAFEARKKYIEAARGQKEARERYAFHGTHPSRVSSLCDRGLLPFGHALNPAKSPVDSGYFGSCKKGVYVSRYADYTLKYANRLIPLRPGERCRTILFRCVPGLSKHIDKMCGPIDPTLGFDSHSSPQFLEWFLFNADQCCPSHILTLEALEDTRTASDDM
eukprot:TRINITY_DN50221_c0_g1_i1.p1 TRINITY_DN50221_c0_g1~~TRINITY_DN50221_c0_g1_i1.p1  ORF type:complete len:423 (-),score=73.40 TRINITY_DN50221_c0_g1_i1:136-1404(-)